MADASPKRPPSSPNHSEATRRRLEWFARWSDDVFRLPGTRIRVGLEPLIGLLPGVGDAAGLVVSAYIPLEAWRVGAPWRLIGLLLVNIAFDAILGTIPLAGDLFDFAYKANRRNVRLLTEWLDADAPPTSRS